VIRPVLGDTTGVAPSHEPCITSSPLAASIAQLVVIFSSTLLYE
jgi:hypothetical protein